MKVIAKITRVALAAGFVAFALSRPSKVRATTEPESAGSRNPGASDQAAHGTATQQQNQTQNARAAAFDARGNTYRTYEAETNEREKAYSTRAATANERMNTYSTRVAAVNEREDSRIEYEDTRAALLNNMRGTISDVRATVPESSRESSREYLQEPLLCIGSVDVRGVVPDSSGATFRMKERSSGAEKDSSGSALRMTKGSGHIETSSCHPERSEGSCTSGAEKDSSGSALRMTEGGSAEGHPAEGGSAEGGSAKARDAKAHSAKSRPANRRSNKSNKSSKRWLAHVTLSITIIAGLIVATAGASYAYITLATNAEQNPVASRKIQISLIENDEEVTTPTRSMPLGIDTKKVEVYNPPGAGDAVVRVTFSPQFISSDSSDDQTLYEFNETNVITAPVNNQAVMGSTTLYFADDWNNASNGWLYKDGYFYYNRVLEAGNKTPPLLTGITTSLASVNIEIVVSAEGLQAHPNQAVEVWGVSIS